MVGRGGDKRRGGDGSRGGMEGEIRGAVGRDRRGLLVFGERREVVGVVGASRREEWWREERR